MLAVLHDIKNSPRVPAAGRTIRPRPRPLRKVTEGNGVRYLILSRQQLGTLTTALRPSVSAAGGLDRVEW